jgi:hypothetical protein
MTDLLEPGVLFARRTAESRGHRERAGMTQFEKLPMTRGVFRVLTASGTVHIIDIQGRAMWERRPAPGAVPAAYDFHPVILSELGPGWEVGGQGFLVVADESYLTGATTHLTATIISISEEPEP